MTSSKPGPIVGSGPAAASDETPVEARAGLRVWSAVILLMLLGMLNVMDRFLPAILVEPIKHDLALSDAAMGFINGFGFLVIYAGLALPIARVADRGGLYGAIISGSVALWGLMTMLGGFVQTGGQLVLTRVGLAVGQAGAYPASQAYISSKFPPEKRAAPQAIFTLSVPLASTAGLLGGGLLGSAWGWRMTFVVMGVISMLTAPLVLLIVGAREKKAVEAKSPHMAKGQIGLLLSKRSFLAILAGVTFIGVGGYTLSGFGPAFLMRSHHLTLAMVGVRYGVVNGLLAMPSLLVMGVLVDRLTRRDPRWPLWILAMVTTVVAPLGVVGFLVSSSSVAIGCMSATNIVPAVFMVPTVVSVHRLTPVELRATASAIMLLMGALVGGLGPVMTGMISDALHPTLGAAALGRALLIVPIAFFAAGICFLIATRYLRSELPDSGAGAR